MKIHRRVLRNIKDNTSFYVSSILLTMFAVYVTIITVASIDMIDSDFRAIMQKGNVEDAEFKTLQPISDEDIEMIETKFSVQLEKINYIDSEEDNYSLRVFAPTAKVNMYQMVKGNDISSDDEVLLNPDFAIANSIEIGDTIEVLGNTYTVAGTCVRPDYLYAQKEITDYYVDDATFGQVTMSEAAFNNLENTQSYYAITYEQDNDLDVREYIYNNFRAISYLSAESNNRISLSKDMKKEYSLIINSFVPVMFLMIAFIVAVVLGRMVKNDQKRIGTLRALGYRKRELASHYALYALIPSITGSLLGILISAISLKPACAFFALDFETVNYHASFPVSGLLMVIIWPLILYSATAVLVVLRLLRHNTISLLHGGAGEEKNKSGHILMKRKMKFKYKFQLRNLYVHKSRTLVVFSGLFIGSFISAFGFIFMDSSQGFVDTELNKAGSSNYLYYLNTLETEKVSEGETVLTSSFEIPGDTALVTVNGVGKNIKLLNLTTESGEDAEYGKYYLTSNAAAKYNLEKGEQFTFQNILTLEEYTVTISGIITDNTQAVLYTSKENLAELMGISSDSYNLIISSNELSNIDSSKVATIVTRETMKNQIERAVKLIYSMVYFLVIIGGVISIISVYLIVNMLIEENKVNISMLKVLGYRNKEINSIILNVNHIIVPVSFIAGIWICLMLSKKMFESFVDILNIYIKPIISVKSIVICLIIIIVSYIISLWMLKKKVFRVDMVESLKDNRD